MTEHYIGTKIILAWEQSLNGAPGYAVKYDDGYTSWSPQDTFERAYIGMGHVGDLPAHMQRVVGELVQLQDKVGKLRQFASTAQFGALPKDERNRLGRQLAVMDEYVDILQERYDAFRQGSLATT